MKMYGDPMIEALITNFPVHVDENQSPEAEQMAFFEKPLSEYSDLTLMRLSSLFACVGEEVLSLA